MALNVDQIIQVAWPAILREMNKPYRLTWIVPLTTSSNFVANLYDPVSNHQVPLIWTRKDNEIGSEHDKIRLAKALLINGVNALDSLINASPNDVNDVEDVIFD